MQDYNIGEKMQNNFDFKEIKKLKELGDILKIKFIPDLYKVYNIETPFNKFFIHKDDLDEYTDKIQKEFDELFMTLFGVYILDKKEYFNLMETLRVRMELADDVFKKLRREVTLILKRTEKKTVEKNGEVWFQIWRSEQRQKFLSKVYNLEEIGKQFKMLVEITYDKGVIEFLKKENHNLESLRNVFCLIYNEREWHYRLLEEMLLYDLRVSSDKIEYFEKVIVKNIGEKLMANFTNIEKSCIINEGKEKNIFAFKNFELEIILETETDRKVKVQKKINKIFNSCNVSHTSDKKDIRIEQTKDFTFIVKGTTYYSKYTDFRTEEGLHKFRELQNVEATIEKTKTDLANNRVKYAQETDKKTKEALGRSIQDAENQLKTLIQETQRLTKEIRRIENDAR